MHVTKKYSNIKGDFRNSKTHTKKENNKESDFPFRKTKKEIDFPERKTKKESDFPFRKTLK